MKHLLLLSFGLPLALLSFAGCSHDTAAPLAGVPSEALVSSQSAQPAGRGLSRRILWLDDPASEPMGRLAGDRIDFDSIRLYKSVLRGPPGPNEITGFALYRDDLGYRAWDGIDFQAPALVVSRMEMLTDFEVVVDQDGGLIGVDPGRRFPPKFTLAVSYVVIDTEGERHPVGDDPRLGDRTVEIPGFEGLFYRLKLLQAPPLRPGTAAEGRSGDPAPRS